jgi:hypothetical protein
MRRRCHEAHTNDVWQDSDDLDDKVVFASPKSLHERSQMGQLCVCEARQSSSPRSSTVSTTPRNTPTRVGRTGGLYFDQDGRVSYKSAPGPFGFHPKGVAETLQKLVPGGATQATPLREKDQGSSKG